MIDYIIKIIESEGIIMDLLIASFGVAIVTINTATLLTTLKINKYCKEISKKI